MSFQLVQWILSPASETQRTKSQVIPHDIAFKEFYTDAIHGHIALVLALASVRYRVSTSRYLHANYYYFPHILHNLCLRVFFLSILRNSNKRSMSAWEVQPGFQIATRQIDVSTDIPVYHITRPCLCKLHVQCRIQHTARSHI